MLTLVIALVVIGASLFYYSARKKELNDVIILKHGPSEVAEAEEIAEIEESERRIKVYVAGEVNSSGVYDLPPNSRVVDAIEQAGGATQYADLLSINLAKIIGDEDQIIVPKIVEETANEPNLNLSQVGYRADTQNSLININSATMEELMQLPNVGNVTAQNIISYRETKSKFSTISDIKNVTGIGEKTFEGLKDLIAVR